MVELMIVVSIITILASVAIPGFIKYVRSSKTSEALASLKSIYDGEVGYYNREKTLRSGATLTTQFVNCLSNPATPPAGVKQVVSWQYDNWPLIDFAMDSPVAYSYTADAVGTGTTSSFTARAEGDLDADTVYSLFERSASIDPSTGDVSGSGGIYFSRDTE